MKFLTAAVLCALAVSSCGRDESVGSEAECQLSASFSKVYKADEVSKISGATKLGKDFEVVSYEANLTPECGRLVENRSGRFYYRLTALSEPSAGYLFQVNMGNGRTISYPIAANDAYPLEAGSVSAEKEFSDVYGQGGDRKWILPWTEPPYKISVLFALPAPADPVLYPRDVGLYLKALDN